MVRDYRRDRRSLRTRTLKDLEHPLNGEARGELLELVTLPGPLGKVDRMLQIEHNKSPLLKRHSCELSLPIKEELRGRDFAELSEVSTFGFGCFDLTQNRPSKKSKGKMLVPHPLNWHIASHRDEFLGMIGGSVERNLSNRSFNLLWRSSLPFHSSKASSANP